MFRDLSKPMGALEPDRLRQFVDRYEDWKADDGSLQVKTSLDHGPFVYSNCYLCALYLLFTPLNSGYSSIHVRKSL